MYWYWHANEMYDFACCTLGLTSLLMWAGLVQGFCMGGKVWFCHCKPTKDQWIWICFLNIFRLLTDAPRRSSKLMNQWQIAKLRYQSHDACCLIRNSSVKNFCYGSIVSIVPWPTALTQYYSIKKTFIDPMSKV